MEINWKLFNEIYGGRTPKLCRAEVKMLSKEEVDVINHNLKLNTSGA